MVTKIFHSFVFSPSDYTEQALSYFNIEILCNYKINSIALIDDHGNETKKTIGVITFQWKNNNTVYKRDRINRNGWIIAFKIEFFWCVCVCVFAYVSLWLHALIPINCLCRFIHLSTNNYSRHENLWFFDCYCIYVARLDIDET